MRRHSVPLTVLTITVEKGGLFGRDKQEGEHRSAVLSRSSRSDFSAVHLATHADPWGAGRGDGLAFPQGWLLALSSRRSRTHGGSRRWRLAAVWDAIRSVFVSVPGPRISHRVPVHPLGSPSLHLCQIVCVCQLRSHAFPFTAYVRRVQHMVSAHVLERRKGFSLNLFRVFFLFLKTEWE